LGVAMLGTIDDWREVSSRVWCAWGVIPVTLQLWLNSSCCILYVHTSWMSKITKSWWLINMELKLYQYRILRVWSLFPYCFYFTQNHPEAPTYDTIPPAATCMPPPLSYKSKLVCPSFIIVPPNRVAVMS
jgi:hypothetical protein